MFTKSIVKPAKEISLEKGEVTAYVAIHGNVDFAGEMGQKGMFAKTIGPGGRLARGLVACKYNHDELVGQIIHAEDDETGLLTVQKYSKSNKKAQEVLGMQAEGLLSTYSYKYRVPPGGDEIKGGIRILKEVELFEAGPVDPDLAVNDQTFLVAVKGLGELGQAMQALSKFQDAEANARELGRSLSPIEREQLREFLTQMPAISKSILAMLDPMAPGLPPPPTPEALAEETAKALELLPTWLALKALARERLGFSPIAALEVKGSSDQERDNWGRFGSGDRGPSRSRQRSGGGKRGGGSSKPKEPKESAEPKEPNKEAIAKIGMAAGYAGSAAFDSLITGVERSEDYLRGVTEAVEGAEAAIAGSTTDGPKTAAETSEEAIGRIDQMIAWVEGAGTGDQYSEGYREALEEMRSEIEVAAGDDAFEPGGGEPGIVESEPDEREASLAAAEERGDETEDSIERQREEEPGIKPGDSSSEETDPLPERNSPQELADTVEEIIEGDLEDTYYEVVDVMDDPDAAEDAMGNSDVQSEVAQVVRRAAEQADGQDNSRPFVAAQQEVERMADELEEEIARLSPDTPYADEQGLIARAQFLRRAAERIGHRARNVGSNRR